MKKALLYSIFALSIASTTLTSCEDIFGGFLDKQPSNELTGEQVFSDWNLTVPPRHLQFPAPRCRPHQYYLARCSNRFG